MTTGDWIGLICLAGLVGFFAGGFFVWNLFFKRDQPHGDDAEADESEPLEDVRQPDEERGERNA